MEQPVRSARRSSHRFRLLLGGEVIVERLRLIPGPPRRSRCPGGARRLHGTALRAHRELPAAERLYTASHEAPGFHPTGPLLNLFGTEPAPPRRPQPHINGFGGTERSRAETVPGQPNSGLGEKCCCTEVPPSRGFLRAVRSSEWTRYCGTGVGEGLRGDPARSTALPLPRRAARVPPPLHRSSAGGAQGSASCSHPKPLGTPFWKLNATPAPSQPPFPQGLRSSLRQILELPPGRPRGDQEFPIPGITLSPS